MNIVVCVKQVMDPDTPISAFIVDEAEKKLYLPKESLQLLMGIAKMQLKQLFKSETNKAKVRSPFYL